MSENANKNLNSVASPFGASAGAGRGSSRGSPRLVHGVQLAFAHAMQPVFYAMAGVLAAAFAITTIWLPPGKLSESPTPQRSAILGAVEPDPQDMEA